MAYKMGNVNKGLILHLPLDQVHKQGANYADISASGYPGTPVGAPTATTDRFGRENMALALNGVDQYLNLPFAFNWSTFSIGAWVRVNINDTLLHIFDGRDSLADGVNFYRFTDNKILLRYNGVNGGTSSSLLASTGWAHVMFSVVANSMIKAYFNSLFEIETSIVGQGMISTTANAVVGARSFTSPANPFNGSLADLRIYNRALTAGEVQAIYRLGGQYHGNRIIRP